MRKRFFAIMKQYHIVLYSIIGNLLAISMVSAANSALSNDISLHNEYLYRLINRELSIHPKQNFSDNMRPIAARALKIINLKPLANRNYAIDRFNKLKPVQDIRMQAIHNDGSNSKINGAYGEQYVGDNNNTLNISGDTAIKNVLLLSYDTRIQYDAAASNLSLYRFRLKTAFSNISISYAKDSLLLGPGYFGSLITSNNVRPYPLALIKTEIPYLIPTLGSFRWYLWHSWYNNDNISSPDIKMLGMRVSLKPHKLLEMSLTRTSTYGGSGRSINSLSKLSSVFTAKDENAGTNINTDQLVGADASLYLPFLNKYSPFLGGKLYTEYVWNDVAAFWQTEDKGSGRIFELLGKSYLYGLYLTTGKLDFRFEYVKTAPALYAHSTLGTTGSSVNGYLIGHYIGRDSNGYLSEVYYEWNRQLHLSVNAGFIERAQRSSNSQFSRIYGFGVKYFYSAKIQLELKTNYIFMDKTDLNPSPIYYNFIEDNSTDWQSTANIIYRL